MSASRAAAAHDRSVRLGPALSASFGMLRERSVVTIGLGAAVVLSLLSVCCGLGFITTPWFLCELFAVQLALCTRTSVVRGRAFVPAALILLGAVLMVSAVAALTLLGAGAELTSAGVAQDSFDLMLRSGGIAALVSSVLALLLAAPWLYGPLILLDQRTRFDVAILESVRIMVKHGGFASLRLSLGAHLVQASPLMLAALLARITDASQVPLFVLVAAPLLCVSVPLGQGMIVWAYVQLREQSARASIAPPPTSIAPPPASIAPPSASMAPPPGSSAPLAAASTRTSLVSEPAAHVQPLGPHARATRPAERCVRAWSVLLVLPIAALLLLELSLWRPSRVPEGEAPDGELVARLTPQGSELRRAQLPNTALEVMASTQRVRIVASDGGGVGELPLSEGPSIDQVRVVRVRDMFAIELRQGSRAYTTWVDRGGVRLDDDLRARLSDRVSPLQLLVFLCSLLATAVASVPVLYALGRAQHGHRLPLADRPSAEALAQDDTRSLRNARNVALLLLPLSLTCLVMAVLALRGPP